MGDRHFNRAALQQLQSLGLAGVGQLPKAAPIGLPSAAPPKPAQQSPRPTEPPRPPEHAAPHVVPSQAPASGPKPESGASTAPSLELLQQEVAACTLCQELAGSRTQTVFGVGDPAARLCFLGEAPGADEDRQGEPFVGRAGQLLDKIIEACTLQRSEVYILNILKCRPPGNRNPSPDESSNCRRFLARQLELIQPEFICCLGAVAAQNLLETTHSIGRLRGKVHQHNGFKVVCTYHPAYLLRNPSAKKDTWEDMKMLMRQLGVEL